MTDTKFNIDPPDLPEERINKHKDFKKLLYNYQLATKPLYKTALQKFRYKRVLIIILLILLVMFLLIEVNDNEDKNSESPPEKEQIKE